MLPKTADGAPSFAEKPAAGFSASEQRVGEIDPRPHCAFLRNRAFSSCTMMYFVVDILHTIYYIVIVE